VKLSRNAVRYSIVLYFAAIAAVLTPSLLRPDALVITRAMLATTISEIFIRKDTVVVELEIGVRDAPAFQNLLPDELYEALGNEPEPWGARLARFFEQDFSVSADQGPPLPGRLTDIEIRNRIQRDEVTGEPLPVQAEDAERVVYARLAYPLPGHPASLTFSPPGGDPGRPVANVGFITYHDGLHINDFRYLGQPERVVLDWEDPWYSQFENRNLWRQYKSPISAFLYVEPFEVRKEIVIRPKDLEQWIDLGLEGRDVIPVEEQEELKARVIEWLEDRNPVTIDGRPAEGFLDRAHFIYRTLRTSGVVDPPRDLDVTAATLGVIWVYPTESLPDSAAMTWELFSDRVPRIPGAVTDEAGALPYFLTEEDNILGWENFLTNPTTPGLVPVEAPPAGDRVPALIVLVTAIVGLVLTALLVSRSVRAGSGIPRWGVPSAVLLLLVLAVSARFVAQMGQLSDDETRTVVSGLLLNVYKAFDYRQEEVIYDALARTTSGELLTDVYLETRRSLELANQGGARAKVRTLEVTEATNEPVDRSGSFRSRASWNVYGSVGHWGHVHQRVNRYDADLTVEVIDGAWRITELDVLQEERLPTTSSPAAAANPAGGAAQAGEAR
jgi:hypothetical protein